jgi:hypothetical protein
MDRDPRRDRDQPELTMGDQEVRVQVLLNELCVKLGFCLSPGEQRRLRESAPNDVDSFTDAVLEAEGVDPRVNKQIRRTVRDTIEWHMRRWA